MKGTMRLDKMLGHSGYGTRREIKELCRSGVVRVADCVVKDSSAKIDPQQDVVTVRGERVLYEEFSYVMLYKPAGILSATTDRMARTVLDLLPQEFSGAGLFPVGRLDKDTTGLLLLTNDGDWAHRITAPKKHVNKVYKALLTIPQSGGEFRFRVVLTMESGEAVERLSDPVTFY